MHKTVDRLQFTFVCAGLLLAAFSCNVESRWARNQVGPAPPSQTVRAAAHDTIDIALVEGQEVDLVEAVVSHRDQYEQRLSELYKYYKAHGRVDKAQWAAYELDGFRRVKQFRYLLDAEVPAFSFRPTESIEQADALFEKGLQLLRSGGHGVPGIFRRDRMIEAAETFRQLIQQYPNSDKIDDAAFWCGEIHKEYLPGQEAIAVKWYERAWTWNPETPHPARFQAAVVYDFRLHNRVRALELYQGALKYETQHEANLRFAAKRIEELTKSNGSDSQRTSRP